MNHIKSYFYLILIGLAVIFYSCTKEEPLGKWDDCIKLSTKSVDFDSGADSVMITTEGEWWWITHVTVNGEIFGDSAGFIDTVPYIFSEDCFVVERRDKTTLFIAVKENPLSEKRRLVVGLEAGDYFDYVAVTQAPK